MLREKGRHRAGWDVTGCDAEPGAPATVEEGQEAREVGDRGKWESGDRDQDDGDGHLDGAGSVGWTAMDILGTHCLWSCRDVRGCCGRESCDLKDQLRKGREPSHGQQWGGCVGCESGFAL